MKPTHKVAVLGAGVTGLAIAQKLSEYDYSVEVFEREKRVGGLASTFKHKDFYLDYGPHKIYSQLPGVIGKIKALLGDELIEIPKSMKIRLKGKYYDYPFKITQLLTRTGPVFAVSAAASGGIATLKDAVLSGLFKNEPKNYEEFLQRRFGGVIYDSVFKSFALKAWGDPKELSVELAKARIAIPSIFELVKRIVLGNMATGAYGKEEITAKNFLYPRKGMVRFSERLAELLEERQGKVHLNHSVKKVVLTDNKVDYLVVEHDGKEKNVKAESVVSTLPLRVFLEMLEPRPPERVLEAVRSLQLNDMLLVYVFANRDKVLEDNWIFYPELEFSFNRLSEQKNFSSEMGPKGKTCVCAEITYDPNKELWNASDDVVVQRVVADLEKADVLTEEEIYSHLKNFSSLIPQGSPMAGIGNKYQLMSLSNCFVLPNIFFAE